MPANTYLSILQSVQTQIKTIVPNCLIRRRLLWNENDVLPIVYVVPDLPAGERVYGNAFIGPEAIKPTQYDYPVIVCYIQAGANDLITGLDTFLEVHQAMKYLLYQPVLAGAAVVYDIEIDPDATNRFNEFLGTNFDVAAWLITYRTNESRL